jgi:1-acyl-sn-glycerol-3-phosphate acyltransferase
MPWYKLILGRVFALYAIIIFILLLVPAFLLFVLVNNFSKLEAREKNIHQVFVAWMDIFMPLIFCPVRRIGQHHFKPHQSYVIVANHNSLMDIPVSSPSIPVANKTLGKHSFANIPLFGYTYKLGGIMVDRNNTRSKVESFIKMKQALKSGLSICLYPEGTRNTSHEPLLSFQDGAFKLALTAQVPIIPAIITNTKRILPANGLFFWAWPHVITITFFEAINSANKTTDELKIQVRDIMTKGL